MLTHERGLPYTTAEKELCAALAKRLSHETEKCAVQAKLFFMPFTNLRHEFELEPLCRLGMYSKPDQAALLAHTTPHLVYPSVNIRVLLLGAQQRAHVAKE